MHPLLLLLASFSGSQDAAATTTGDAQELPLPASWRLRTAPVEETETLRFTVLGIDWENGRVAFQQIYRVETVWDMDGHVAVEPYPCAYSHPELKGFPAAGLTVGIWNVSQDRLEQRYTPFPAASGEAGCAPNGQGPLDWLAVHGGFPGAGEMPGTALGDSLPISVTTGRIREGVQTVERESMPVDALGGCDGLFSLEYRVLGWPARRIWTPEMICMASEMSVEVKTYWSRGDQVLLLEHFKQINRFAGMSNSEAHRFTLLGLSDNGSVPTCDAWAQVSDPDPAGLNVRGEPGTTGQIVDRLPLGTRVHVLDSKNGWLFLDRGVFGWSSQSERTITAPGWVHGGLLTTAGSGEVILYQSPGETEGGQGVSGGQVSRVHGCRTGWLEVTAEGQRGWVMGGLPQ